MLISAALLAVATGLLPRRAVLKYPAGIMAMSVPRRSVASTRDTLFATGTSERCENGEGEACSQLAEGNELILKLQQKSRENKETNAKELYEKTVRQLGYSDFFSAVDMNLVLLPNGTYATFTASEYYELRKAGKIKPGAVDELRE